MPGLDIHGVTFVAEVTGGDHYYFIPRQASREWATNRLFDRDPSDGSDAHAASGDSARARLETAITAGLRTFLDLVLRRLGTKAEPEDERSTLVLAALEARRPRGALSAREGERSELRGQLDRPP